MSFDYRNTVQDLMATSFGLTPEQMREDNETWKQWLELGPRDWRDLNQLITSSDVRDAFKARAMIILLIPNTSLIPFAWKTFLTQIGLTNYLPLQREWRWEPETWSEALQKFLCDLLLINIEYVRTCPHEAFVEVCTRGYNLMIVDVLQLRSIGDERAESLFGQFQINDPIAFWNLEHASGYNPFRELLCAPNVPEIWKKKADDEMCRIILEEQSGAATPRKEWEGAYACYRKHVQMCLFVTPFPYSSLLFASQAEFLLGLSNPEGKAVFAPHCLLKIFRLLQDNEFCSLRDRIARQTVVEVRAEFDVFRIYNSETEEVARFILEYFPKDREICECLRALIEESDTRSMNARRVQEQRDTRAKHVLSLMR